MEFFGFSQWKEQKEYGKLPHKAEAGIKESFIMNTSGPPVPDPPVPGPIVPGSPLPGLPCQWIAGMKKERGGYLIQYVLALTFGPTLGFTDIDRWPHW